MLCRLWNVWALWHRGERAISIHRRANAHKRLQCYAQEDPNKNLLFLWMRGSKQTWGGASLKIDIRDREALLRAFKQNWTDFICVSECKSRGYVSLYVFDYCNKFPRLIQIRLLIICVQLISFLV